MEKGIGPTHWKFIDVSFVSTYKLLLRLHMVSSQDCHLRLRRHLQYLNAWLTYDTIYLEVLLPAALRAAQSDGIQVTQRAILSFFRPQGTHVTPMV